jgi:DNA polymerase I-like protein with 3'-5' exonuclease and polymerase domains
MGASTGRLSSADPNMQNVPKRPSDADERMDLGASVLKLIRGIFVPEEGERWGRQDLSQIEFRYLAHFAVGRGEEEVREAYRRDPRVDFHDQCAIMADLPRDKPNRTRVKNVNFCKCYGGGVDKIAATAGIAREEAAAFVERYDAALPFIMETRRRAERSAQRHGYVTTILLRRQRFDFWEPADGGGGRPLPRAEAEARAHGSDLKRAWTYAALNWKMQGSNADHVKKAIADARESGAWRALGPALLTVHDENNWSVPRTREGTEAFEEVRRIMETCIELSVPVLSESDFGDDWGEAS